MYFVSSEKSSGSYWLLHTALPSPLFTHQTKHARESRCDYYKSTKYYQPFFYERETNVSSLHKIICSLVSLFSWYIMKVVAACKVSSVFNRISPSFKLISYLKENIKFNKLSITYREHQKALSYFLVRMHITPVA